MSQFVDRVQRDLGHIADRATPSPTAWEEIQTRIADQADQPEMEIIMLQKKPPSPRPTTPLVLAAAALVVLVVGVVFVLTRSDGDTNSIRVTDEAPTSIVTTSPPTSEAPATTAAVDAADPAAAAAVDVAVQFMEARDAHDVAAVRALLADEVAVAGAEWGVSDADDYPLLVEFERAGGLRFLDPECGGGVEGRVVCSYTIESDTSRALGVGPFAGNSFLLVISDGRIQEITHNFTTPDWVPLVDTPFRSWVDANHPDDLNTLYDNSFGTGAPRVTDESVPLWETRIAEFVASLAAGE